MKILNRLLNIYILVVIVFLSYIIFVNYFEANMYNENSTGKYLKNYNNIAYVNGALDNYFSFYFKGDIESIKLCTVKDKVKSDKVYSDKTNEISDKKLNMFYIKDIQKRFGNVYIVNFYLNSEEDFCLEENLYKVIFKLNKTNSTFKVYYDGLVDKGEN